MNRLKRAYCCDTHEIKPSRKRERRTRRKLPTRTDREDEEEGEIRIGPFPLMQPPQQQDEPELTIPPDQILDTPEPNNQTVDIHNSERCDPTFAPATTPRSRRALQPTREEPPLTRLRARVTLQDNVTQCENNYLRIGIAFAAYDLKWLIYNTLDSLQTSTSDIVHSLTNQVTYVKKLDTMARVNANAIANLSSIVKDIVNQPY